jgi:uncharacterized protein
MASTPLIKQGWLRVILYFIGILLLTISIPFLSLPLINQVTDDKETAFNLVYISIGIFTILFTWLMKRFVDRQPFSSLGFAWKHYKTDAGLGFFTALAVLGLGTLILVLQHHVSFTGVQAEVLSLASQMLFMIAVAFIEEIIFRGYILNNLMASMNKWIALFISALIFAGVHATNPGASMIPIVNVFLAGMLLGSNYIFTRNLWFAIFFHFAWNFTQGPLLGYEVSGVDTVSLLKQTTSNNELLTGGEFGFEGSILSTMLLLLCTIVWLFLFHKKYEQQESTLGR